MILSRLRVVTGQQKSGRHKVRGRVDELSNLEGGGEEREDSRETSATY